MQSGATAVVADDWPLVRLGIVQALRTAGLRVVAESQSAEDALRGAAAEGATYLLVGTVRDAGLADVARRALATDPPPDLIVRVDSIGRDELAAVVAAGASAVLSRSLRPVELVDALERVDRGERVVAPAFLSLLVGALEPGQGGATTDDGAPPLTRKEVEVLARLAQGRTNREIADALFITPATVKSHLAHIYAKLGVTGRQEAVARAVALGLLS